MNIKILTVNEVANLFHVSPSTIYKWTTAHKIPCVKINGKLLYMETDLNKLINQKRFSNQAEIEKSVDEQLYNIKNRKRS